MKNIKFLSNKMNNKIKKIFFKQNWEYDNYYYFILNDNYDNYIGSCYLYEEFNCLFLCNLYVDEKYIGNKYSNILIQDAINYANINIKKDIYLYCDDTYFMYDKYKKFGFEYFEKNKLILKNKN